MPGRMEFEFSSRAPGARPVSTDPLRILVMGDFSGRGPRDLAERRPLAVDVDNFDEDIREKTSAIVESIKTSYLSEP